MGVSIFSLVGEMVKKKHLEGGDGEAAPGEAGPSSWAGSANGRRDCGVDGRTKGAHHLEGNRNSGWVVSC